MRVETIGNATLYLGDCADVIQHIGKPSADIARQMAKSDGVPWAGMGPKKRSDYLRLSTLVVDAVVTDPPYGIGEADGKNKSRGLLADPRDYGNDGWDNQTVNLELMFKIRTLARWAIIFGGNYYPQPASSCWLVWDKENGDTDFADCELAWTNLPKAVRRIRYMWNGMLRANGEARGDHPTQKPIGVMEWAVNHLPAPNQTILDPFMGSGTTGVACMRLGRHFVGIEREIKYFDVACRRIEDAQRQARMFA